MIVQCSLILYYNYFNLYQITLHYRFLWVDMFVYFILYSEISVFLSTLCLKNTIPKIEITGILKSSIYFVKRIITLISLDFTLDASRVLMRSTSSTGLPSDADSLSEILSSIFFNSAFILALLTISWSSLILRCSSFWTSFRTKD